MLPVITPVLKKRRLSGIERLQISIPSADVKRDQRKRKKKSSDQEVNDTETVPSNEEVLADLLITSIGTGETSPLSNKDNNCTTLRYCDSSDQRSLTSNSSILDDSSMWDDNEEEAVAETNTQQALYSNRIIDFQALKDLVELGCVCRLCKGPVVLTEITIGVATTVVMMCRDCDEGSQRTESETPTVDGNDICKRQGIRDKSQYIKKTIKRFIDFPIHYSLVLLMQQLGCGLEGIRAIFSHLGITDTIGDWEKWRLVMESVGTAQQQVARDCMLDNIKEEIGRSQEAGHAELNDNSGVLRQGITVSIDMGWQKRSSGTRYDSPSGVSLMLGGMTKKILHKHVCGKLCSVCKSPQSSQKDSKMSSKHARNHRCPLNYEGTSKGMESAAAVECVRELFHCTTDFKDCPPAFVDVIISDDDSSTWANLQQSLTQRLLKLNEDNLAAGLPILLAKQAPFWPKNKQGQPKKDYGKLSMEELPPRINLADPNHRTKVLGKHLYPLTTQRKDSGRRITKPMAERLKLHFGKALHQNRHECTERLEQGLRATLEHEFGNHEHCSNVWCRYLKANDPETRLRLSRRWMNKVDDSVLYATLNSIYNDFLTPKRIEQMYHGFDTQKNESMNQKIARMCPKTTTLSKTMVLSDRVAWVVIEDSIGGAHGVACIYKQLQLGVVPHHLVSFYMKNDKRRDHQHRFKLQPHVKHRRRKALNEKIWEERREGELSRQKGQTYESGVAFGDDIPAKRGPKPKKSDTVTCTHCGCIGHSRTSSKKMFDV